MQTKGIGSGVPPTNIPPMSDINNAETTAPGPQSAPTGASTMGRAEEGHKGALLQQQRIINRRKEYVDGGMRDKLFDRYASEVAKYVEHENISGNSITMEDAKSIPLGKIFTYLPIPPKKTEDLPPGTMVICAERDVNNPTFPSRKMTFWLHGQEDHNGTPSDCNAGDKLNVHALIKTSNPGKTPDSGNLQATEHWAWGEEDYVEGRGGEVRHPETNEIFPGTAKGDISRVQPTAGNLAALTNPTNKFYVAEDKTFASNLALFAQRMANGQIIYSKAELSSGARGDWEMTPEAEKELVNICKDQQEGNQQWAYNHTNTAAKAERGVNCVSLAIRAAQVAMMYQLRERAVENGNPNATFEDVIPEMKKLGGIFNANPKFVAVDTYEHLLLHTNGLNGEPLFRFGGKVHIEPKHEEKRPPMSAPQLPPLPETHPEAAKTKARL